MLNHVKNSEYNKKIPQSQTAEKNPVIAIKSHKTILGHQEDKQSKATNFLFPLEMISKLEWTQSSAQQNIEQLQNPTMGVTINKESTTTEPPP